MARASSAGSTNRLRSLPSHDAGIFTRARYQEKPSGEASLPEGGFFQVSGMATSCQSPGLASAAKPMRSVAQARASTPAAAALMVVRMREEVVNMGWGSVI